MAASEKTDRLAISSHGSTQREVGKVVRGIMQDLRDYDTNELPGRVEELRADVANGTYQVQPQDLADAILGRAFGR